MNDFLIRPASIRAALESHGEMSRLRAQAGLRITNSPTVSTYILERRIRATLSEYAKGKSHKEGLRVDRLINKLDKLGKVELEYLYHICTEESVSDMIEVISLTFKKINKLSNQWKDQTKQNLNEDFTTFNPNSEG